MRYRIAYFFIKLTKNIIRIQHSNYSEAFNQTDLFTLNDQKTGQKINYFQKSNVY